jgi:hypothetical protein
MNLPLTISLRASVTLAITLCVIHGLAVFAVAASDLSTAVKIVVWISLVLSLWRGIAIHALRRGARAPIALTLRRDGEVEIAYRDGVREQVLVDARSTVTAWLVVLLVRGRGRCQALSLPRDAVATDQHRQLRLWLRWIAAKPGDTKGQDGHAAFLVK